MHNRNAVYLNDFRRAQDTYYLHSFGNKNTCRCYFSIATACFYRYIIKSGPNGRRNTSIFADKVTFYYFFCRPLYLLDFSRFIIELSTEIRSVFYCWDLISHTRSLMLWGKKKCWSIIESWIFLSRTTLFNVVKTNG